MKASIEAFIASMEASTASTEASVASMKSSMKSFVEASVEVNSTDVFRGSFYGSYFHGNSRESFHGSYIY